jgi:hypothetical protein
MDGFHATTGVIVLAATTGWTCSTRRFCARGASTGE